MRQRKVRAAERATAIDGGQYRIYDALRHALGQHFITGQTRDAKPLHRGSLGGA